VHPDFATKLAALMEMTDRDGYEKPAEAVEAGKPVEEASKRAELGANV
jgi:4-alpha-glucanotransferase